MPSSSLSVLVFEKQKLRYLLQRVPTIRRGWDPRGAIERLSSRSPDQRPSYRLTTKSRTSAHNAAAIPVAVTKTAQLRSLDLLLAAR
jgi:hypothetical protein